MNMGFIPELESKDWPRSFTNTANASCVYQTSVKVVHTVKFEKNTFSASRISFIF